MAMVTLFSYAREKGSLPRGQETEAEFVTRFDEKKAARLESIRPSNSPLCSGMWMNGSRLSSPSAVLPVCEASRFCGWNGRTFGLPYVALNEHLGMQVAAKVVPTARTEVSQDGQALLVHRFDVDEEGQPKFGLEDFCSLLGMRPSAKYETTWERIGKAVRDHVPGPRQRETFHHLAATILLTYALRNADCHSKNIALTYTSKTDVQIAPVYDMLTTCVYAEHKDSPPGISFMGKKTWQPGKNLEKFLAGTFGIPPREQATLVEKIGDAVSETAPLVRQAMESHPGFREIGKHLLNA